MSETKKKEAKVKETKNYIDNNEFVEKLLEYFEVCKQAKDKGEVEPRIPDYIGECFLKIATNLSRAGNFSQYSYRDEMIMDGIENCLMYFRNFDPAKSRNAFSYFTQIVWYAFVRRIEKEKKQSYIKYKITEQHGILEHELMEDSEDGTRMPQVDGLYDNMAEYIQNFEERVEEKRKKRRKKIKKDLPEDNSK